MLWQRVARAAHAGRRLLSSQPFRYQEMFETSTEVHTPWRLVTADGVRTEHMAGRTVLHVEPRVLTQLTSEAMVDIAHLLRPAHLEQLRRILDDPDVR